MAISYNKLWKLLIDREMSKANLRRAAGIAPNTMTKLNRDEEVTLETLGKICAILNVNIGDIVDFLPTDQKLSKMNCVNDRELDEYIDRVIGTMSEDQLSELEQSPYPYVVKIQGKVKELIAQHRSSVFDTWLEQDKISCLPNYALPAVISPTAFTSMVPKSLYTAEEDMNEYEFKVVWALSELGNVKWWHRNISRLGFQINGPVHAYPDIIVMLHSGKILMVETKGDHLDNDESKEKAKIGDQWAKLAGKQYKYYMVFETKQPDYPGAYSLERFMEIVNGL